MRLALKVQDVPDKYLDPITDLIQNHRTVIDGWALTFSGSGGSIKFYKGKLEFDPPLSISKGMVSTSITEGSVEVKEGHRTLVLDVDMSPIDLRLV